MKKTFLVITEKGRIRYKRSYYIAEINSTGLHLIDNDLTTSLHSTRDIKYEVIDFLIRKNIIPEKLTDDFDKNYNLIIVDGQGLNYVNSNTK